MPRPQRKNFDTPDEARLFTAGRIEVVNLDETSIGRLHFEPGWRWSIHVGPIAGTRSCQHRHLGYAFCGSMHVVFDDGATLDVLPGDVYEIPPGHDAWILSEVAFEAIEFASARLFAAPPAETGERTLATVLFTDIVDSTAQLETLGDAVWRERVIEHNRRMRAQIDRFRGREITTTGDGFLAIFDSASRAVGCAAAMGPAVRDLGLAIRAGLHTGEVELVGGDARGLAIHEAARMSSLAQPGEVFVSATTRDLLEGSGLHFADRGEHDLKGLSRARRVFALIP